MKPLAVLACDGCGERDAERLADLDAPGLEMLERFGPPSCLRCGAKMRVEVAGIVTQLERSP